MHIFRNFRWFRSWKSIKKRIQMNFKRFQFILHQNQQIIVFFIKLKYKKIASKISVLEFIHISMCLILIFTWRKLFILYLSEHLLKIILLGIFLNRLLIFDVFTSYYIVFIYTACLIYNKFADYIKYVYNSKNNKKVLFQ